MTVAKDVEHALAVPFTEFRTPGGVDHHVRARRFPPFEAIRLFDDRFQDVHTAAAAGEHRADAFLEPRRVALLQQWIDAGLDLGNHTYSHRDLHTTPLPEFEQEVLNGEKVIRELLRRAGKDLKYFRHPFLHTGRDAQTRAQFESFLRKHGYRVAPVTIDNYDYIFAAAFDRARARGDQPASQKIAAAYLEYMEAVTAFYEQQATAILGREIPQALLLHANALNAATFDQLAQMLLNRGYQFISLEEALREAAYESVDSYYGPAGITWLHRWAISAGKPNSIFVGEPIVPKWIEEAARP